jgi:hypothetical protein
MRSSAPGTSDNTQIYEGADGPWYSRGVQQPHRPASTSYDRCRLLTCSSDQDRPPCNSFTPRRSPLPSEQRGAGYRNRLDRWSKPNSKHVGSFGLALDLRDVPGCSWIPRWISAKAERASMGSAALGALYRSPPLHLSRRTGVVHPRLCHQLADFPLPPVAHDLPSMPSAYVTPPGMRSSTGPMNEVR